MIGSKSGFALEGAIPPGFGLVRFVLPALTRRAFLFRRLAVEFSR
jgi:hypothetical protein